MKESCKNDLDHPEDLKIRKKDCRDVNVREINESNLNFEDTIALNGEYFDIVFTEYAPKAFKKLRAIDNINTEDIIQSLLPMKNTSSIKKSQGRSGNFFISTDDNKYILKTVKNDELELIRNSFLKRYVKHLNRYSKSVICRIHGLYKMHLEE